MLDFYELEEPDTELDTSDVYENEDGICESDADGAIRYTFAETLMAKCAKERRRFRTLP